MAVPFNFIKECLTTIGDLLSYINPFSENFILKDVISGIGNILSYLNPFSDNFFGLKIVELLSDSLKYLFVPENNPFSGLSDKFNEKFAFVSQVKDLANSLLGDIDYGYDNIPSFNINYNGTEVSIIDFTPFLQYRTWLHGIILAIAWFVFIDRLFKRLPGIIGGFSL